MPIRIITGLFWLLVLFAVNVHGAGGVKAAENSSNAPLSEAWVYLVGRPVVPVLAGLHAFSPQDRALAATERLSRVVKDHLFTADMIGVSDNEITSDIVIRDVVLMSITDADAKMAGHPKSQLARDYAEKIGTAFVTYRSERHLSGMLVNASKAFLLTLLLIALLYLVNVHFPRLVALVESLKGGMICSIRFQTIEIINEDRLVSLLVMLLRLLRLLTVLLMLYVYIPMVLSFFPMTEGVAAKLFGYIEAPVLIIWNSFANYIPNVVFLVLITICAHYCVRFSRFFFWRWKSRI